MYHNSEKQSFKFQERYYAVINLDGTIRANKLFKGEDFHKITEMVDLNNYASLNDFILKRKEVCNNLAKSKKEEFINNVTNNSLYIDEEVMATLDLNRR